METEACEIYSNTPNYAVIRHPGRSFPGALIQGDSLAILCGTVDEALEALRSGDTSEAEAALIEAQALLHERLLHYIVVLKNHGIDLPFSAPGHER